MFFDNTEGVEEGRSVREPRVRIVMLILWFFGGVFNASFSLVQSLVKFFKLNFDEASELNIRQSQRDENRR